MSGKHGPPAQSELQDLKNKKPRNDLASVATMTQLVLIQKSQVAKTDPQAVKDFVQGLGYAIAAHVNPGTTTTSSAVSVADLPPDDPQVRQYAELLFSDDGPPHWDPPAPTSHPFTRFAVYMLPPCIDIIWAPRDDLERLRDYVSATNGPNRTAESKASQDLTDAITNYLALVEPKLQAWIDDAFSSLGLPTTAGTGAGYQDDALHIVLIPEFAFNGRFVAQLSFNAEYPLPFRLEAWLTDMVHTKLQTEYSHLRIICAFSMATYMNLNATFNDSGKTKVASMNRMTVVTSTNKPSVCVSKFTPSATDGWKNDPASGLIFGDTNTDFRPADPSGLARLAEINLDLNCFGEVQRSLAFGTCLDAICDGVHGNVNLVVMLGCGCPIGMMKDQQHPFILNDLLGWKLEVTTINRYLVERGAFNGVGLYDRYAARPSILPAAVQDLKTLGVQKKIDGADKWSETPEKCYYRSDLVQEKPFGPNGSRGSIAYLAPMPFPSVNATAVL